RPDPDPARSAQVLASGDPLVARIPVLARDGSPGAEAIVRSVDGGWCTLVPAGPPLVAALEGATWVWYAQGSPVVLSRVPLDGGPVRVVTTLPVMPTELAIQDRRLIAHHGDDVIASEWISDLILAASPADAGAVRLPRVPRGGTRSPEVHGDILRVPVGDYMLQEMVVRITRRGWCTLVPVGPPVELVVARGWVWFVRADSHAVDSPIRLHRVSARGGPIEARDEVPFLPSYMTYRDHDLIAHDAYRRRWIRMVDDEPPTTAPTCD
ncbi:MAG TPA: hypothetical protein VIU61_20505, partial [Kofleriaceae bacterium]